MGGPTSVLLLPHFINLGQGLEGQWVDSTGDIHQSHKLSEHCNLPINNLIRVLRSEDIREHQTLDVEKLREM